MRSDMQYKIEEIVFKPDFYLQDFRNDQAAADFLGVPLADWLAFTDFYEESLHHFIYTMRVEDVVNHLNRNPYASLRHLASQYRFSSRLHLLWHFYKRNKCTPRRWAVNQGLL